MTRLAPIMQGFFTDHLIAQRRASPHTVASYRDTLTLLLGYAHQRSGKLPVQLDLGDLDAVLIGAFLTHLETERGNSTSTRNARLTGLRISDIHLGTGPHVYCRGKGRRDRCTPLTPPTVRTLTGWLAERRGHPDDPVFPTQAGNQMSRDAVARLLGKYTSLASASCPSLNDKAVSPHTLRHSAAMALVAVGVDPTVIALWMGHASPLSTRPYLHADMKLKQQAADRLTPPGTPPGRYHAPDELLAFLADL